MKIPHLVAAVTSLLMQIAAVEAQSACRAAVTKISFEDLELPITGDARISRRQLPLALRRLLGRRVRIVGFAMPADFDSAEMTRFTLRRKSEINPQAPYLFRDDVIINVVAGRTITYTLRSLNIEGTLTLRDVETSPGVFITVFAIIDARLVEQK